MGRYTFFIVSLLLSFSLNTKAQSLKRAGVLPQINYYKSLSSKWALSLKVESRHQFFNSNNLENPNYNYQLSDFFAVGEYKLFGCKLSAGYMLRVFSNNTILHRTLQQVSLSKDQAKMRIGFRLRTDQSFSAEETEYRVRYRVSTEIPLKGNKLNKKELYLKTAHEQLHEINNTLYDLDLRVICSIGYLSASKNRFELGYDFRFDRFINSGYRLNNWLTLACYFK